MSSITPLCPSFGLTGDIAKTRCCLKQGSFMLSLKPRDDFASQLDQYGWNILNQWLTGRSGIQMRPASECTKFDLKFS